MSLSINPVLKSGLIVFIGLMAVLFLTSHSLGWNVVSLLLFWCLMVPALAINVPKWISKKKRYSYASLFGLLLFYAFMVFLIYEHYRSDYFQLILISLVENVGIVCLFLWVHKVPVNVVR